MIRDHAYDPFVAEGPCRVCKELRAQHHHDLEWVKECERWWGRVLVGDKAHYCLDWDLLPVDETVGEFEACHCTLAPNGGMGEPAQPAEAA